MPQVLVVDDEKNVLTSLSIGLRRNEYTVKQAQSGPEALRILEKEPCEFVVSDIRMSPMDGYTLATHIRKKYPQVNIVLMSAYDIDEEKSKLEKKLSCYRLTKPFEVSELVQVLQDQEKKKTLKSTKELATLGNRKICILAEGEMGDQVSHIVQEAGFSTKILKPKQDVLTHMDTNFIDMIIFDGDILDHYDWKVINDLDRQAPNLPVAILVKQSGQTESMEISDLGFMVLSRERFLSDQMWVNQLLRKLMDKY